MNKASLEDFLAANIAKYEVEIPELENGVHTRLGAIQFAKLLLTEVEKGTFEEDPVEESEEK